MVYIGRDLHPSNLGEAISIENGVLTIYVKDIAEFNQELYVNDIFKINDLFNGSFIRKHRLIECIHTPVIEMLRDVVKSGHSNLVLINSVFYKEDISFLKESDNKDLCYLLLTMDGKGLDGIYLENTEGKTEFLSVGNELYNDTLADGLRYVKPFSILKEYNEKLIDDSLFPLVRANVGRDTFRMYFNTRSWCMDIFRAMLFEIGATVDYDKLYRVHLEGENDENRLTEEKELYFPTDVTITLEDYDTDFIMCESSNQFGDNRTLLQTSEESLHKDVLGLVVREFFAPLADNLNFKED